MEELKSLFEHWAGEPCCSCMALSGGGSSRRYYRLCGATRQCVGTVADDVRENEAFFAYTNHLAAKGMPVPQLYMVASDRCHYLQQDLGDQSLYALLQDKKRAGGGFDSQMMQLYRQALADLDRLQRAGIDLDFNLAFPRSEFDRRSMLWDLNYFKYNFLKLANIPFDEELLEDDFEHFVDFLMQADCRYFMYRDFQGRNIMVVDKSSLYYIDYQGGRRGAAQYDVASLLYSAKSDLPEAIRQQLLQHYVALHGAPTFMTHFWGYVLIRIMQAMGAYGYRGLFERKPYFAESIPLAVANLRMVVDSHPLPVHLPELERVWQRISQLGQAAQPATDGRLTVQVMSFSYKRGLPEDTSGNGGGFLFDCRALPNPGRYEQYRAYTGKDRPVIEFLEREEAVTQFIEHAKALVAQSVDKYIERRFTHLSVGFGCTGGQHRSVYCAEQLAQWLRTAYPDIIVDLCHREH
ncbi:MAG: phosphotransferase [Bacteroidales bacterium]|nr:phosphotransferase [Bacteroidales bacterium]